MPDTFLSPEEEDIAARLASYHRKITSLRTAHLPAPEAFSAALQTPSAKNSRQRKKVDRSVVEDYRHARTIQRLLQGACASQLVLTCILSGAAQQPVLLAFLVGDAIGLAASFARVQRSHGLCFVFNLAYLITSAGMPLLLAVALAAAGSDGVGSAT